MAISKKNKKYNFIDVFRQLIPFTRPYRVMIWTTLFLTFIGAITAQVNPLVLKYAVDEVEKLMRLPDPFEQGTRVILIISAIMFGKEILNIFIHFGQKYYGEKIRINISADLAQAAIDKILTYRLAFYTDSDHESGTLQTRIDQGVASLTRLVQNFFIDILPLLANSILALIVMYAANVYVGLVATAVLPVYFFVSYRQAQKLQGIRRQLRRQRENKTNGILNIINSIMVIKSFVRETYESIKQYGIQRALLENQLFTRRTNYIYDSIKTFVEQVGVVLIIIITVFLVLQGQITIGAIMLHIMLFNNISSPIRQLHRIYDEVNDAIIFAETYFDILNADEETEQSGDFKPAKVQGNFELQQVSFTYPNGVKAIEDVSLKIVPGRTTAIVGLSGAGKSTLINLLCKYYAPDRGFIRLDGTDIIEYNTHAYRKNIGLVLQSNHIFRGSIEENIRYGDLDATREAVIEAAKKAFLHEQIMQLPMQYESDATNLSGGQKQRIAIARLFLKDPPIIFLDEPTASLDAIAAEQIKISLDAIKQNRTVVIISHSISQIVDADEIFVLQTGKLVESGNHSSLFDQNGVYREIFDASTRSLNLEKIMDSYG